MTKVKNLTKELSKYIVDMGSDDLLKVFSHHVEDSGNLLKLTQDNFDDCNQGVMSLSEFIDEMVDCGLVFNISNVNQLDLDKIKNCLDVVTTWHYMFNLDYCAYWVKDGKVIEIGKYNYNHTKQQQTERLSCLRNLSNIYFMRDEV